MSQFLNFQANMLNQTQGTLNLSDGYDCQECKNKGFTYFVRGDEVVSRLCACRQKRRAIRIINELNIGGGNLRMESFKTSLPWQEHIKKTAKSFLEEGSGWFFIGGQSGCGKTHICTAISYELIERERSVVYMRWVDKSQEIKQSLKYGTYTDEINKYKRCDVLYIDDLFKCAGGEGISTSDLKIAFEILNYRYADTSKITIISSEYTLSALAQIDEACASRIIERTGKHNVNIDKDVNKNLRRKIG